MADTDKDLSMLEALLDEARQAPAVMPADLRADILQDAASVQVEHLAAGAPETGKASAGPFGATALRLWSQFRSAVGGWPAMGGMAAACGAGLWIGLAPPDFLPDPAQFAQLSAETTAMPYDSYDLALMLDEETE